MSGSSRDEVRNNPSLVVSNRSNDTSHQSVALFLHHVARGRVVVSVSLSPDGQLAAASVTDMHKTGHTKDAVCVVRTSDGAEVFRRELPAFSESEVQFLGASLLAYTDFDGSDGFVRVVRVPEFRSRRVSNSRRSPEQPRNDVIACAFEVAGHIPQDGFQRAEWKRLVVRDCNVMFAADPRGKADVAAGLPGLFVAK
jgi:hypothetical protein